jgi:hypothetical protein
MIHHKRQVGHLRLRLAPSIDWRYNRAVIEARYRENSALRYFTGGLTGTLAGIAIWLVSFALADRVFNLWFFEPGATADYFRQFPLVWRYLTIAIVSMVGGYVCALISRDRVFSILAGALCIVHALYFSGQTWMGWGFAIGTGSANSDIKLLSIAFLLAGFLAGARVAERVIAQYYREKGVPSPLKRTFKPDDPALDGKALGGPGAGENNES